MAERDERWGRRQRWMAGRDERWGGGRGRRLRGMRDGEDARRKVGE